MKILKQILILALCASPLFSFAQPDLRRTNQAAELCQSGDLLGARTIINEAVESPEGGHPYTWYVKGFIHKEIYKEIEKMSPVSESRDLAIDAILRSMDSDIQNQFEDNNRKALEFLAKSFYLDAFELTRSFQPSSEDAAVQFFDRFVQLISLSNPEFDISLLTLDFYKSLGKGFETYYYEVAREKEYINKSFDYYTMAIHVDPRDYESNYNTAINFYNQGVFKIREVDHNTEIFELLVIQEDCIALFKMSLPYMLEAHSQRPERKETLKGLMAIYRALNDYKKSDEYKTTLEKLIKDGVIKN